MSVVFPTMLSVFCYQACFLCNDLTVNFTEINPCSIPGPSSVHVWTESSMCWNNHQYRSAFCNSVPFCSNCWHSLTRAVSNHYRAAAPHGGQSICNRAFRRKLVAFPSKHEGKSSKFRERKKKRKNLHYAQNCHNTGSLSAVYWSCRSVRRTTLINITAAVPNSGTIVMTYGKSI